MTDNDCEFEGKSENTKSEKTKEENIIAAAIIKAVAFITSICPTIVIFWSSLRLMKDWECIKLYGTPLFNVIIPLILALFTEGIITFLCEEKKFLKVLMINLVTAYPFYRMLKGFLEVVYQ